ncbi:MAG: flavodoxin [Methylococcaceae bacterium]|nr:flavodoxin [Methylococcaceae bacterium]MDZ4156336.1 flavodoxin [Methylococcales bacterium]MDP2394597.1 flavodoxin [Methylococcaceae bacterium]MDP3019065.1 flavodoxin [Methylococcaceae bacterium]MDP3390281.1 flavodoxin [Methylococcaceae bacterium]
MAKVGVFFGTDTGNTRRVAKDITTTLGSAIAAKPVNIRNATVEDLLGFETLILGTPTYGEGQLPGLSTGNATESWEEFLPKLAGHDFTGKKVAIYGLGNQKSYPDEFVDAMFYLYDQFEQCGATIIGAWETEGYKFGKSKAIVDDRFVGLVLDQENQKELTPTRLETWLANLAEAWA